MSTKGATQCFILYSRLIWPRQSLHAYSSSLSLTLPNSPSLSLTLPNSPLLSHTLPYSLTLSLTLPYSPCPTSLCVILNVAMNTQGTLGHEFSFQWLELAELTIFVVQKLFTLYESTKCTQIIGATWNVCWRRTWHRCQRFTILDVVATRRCVKICCYLRNVSVACRTQRHTLSDTHLQANIFALHIFLPCLK